MSKHLSSYKELVERLRKLSRYGERTCGREECDCVPPLVVDFTYVETILETEALKAEAVKNSAEVEYGLIKAREILERLTDSA